MKLEVRRKPIKEAVLGVLIISSIFVWLLIFAKAPSKTLSVYFLDVGQGDAILIDTPGHKRMLIDGGKNRKVVSELGKVLPFGSRSIDIVMATHPDADHIGGLPEVISRYDVEIFMEPGTESENSFDEEIDSRLAKKEIETILPKRGMKIDFGDGAILTVLFPNQDVTRWDTNDSSIVARLDYGESSFLLTGDSELRTESILLSLDSEILDTDVLKAGHHGSRTSTSKLFAGAVTPEYAVISAGKDNSYGHPHKEVIAILENLNSEVLNTAERGTIVFETDGVVLKIK